MLVTSPTIDIAPARVCRPNLVLDALPPVGSRQIAARIARVSAAGSPGW